MSCGHVIQSGPRDNKENVFNVHIIFVKTKPLALDFPFPLAGAVDPVMEAPISGGCQSCRLQPGSLDDLSEHSPALDCYMRQKSTSFLFEPQYTNPHPI